MQSDNLQRQQESIVSLKLYRYLCNTVGTEKTVKYRRLYFDVYDDIYTFKENKVRSSGSKAEGLDLPGSDLDVMNCHQRFPVYDFKLADTMCVPIRLINGYPILDVNCKSFNPIFFIMESEYTMPGFVHIIVPAHLHIQEKITVNIEHARVISNRYFKHMYLDMLGDSDSIQIHGPCLSNYEETADLAFCFRSHTWPNAAKHWLSRMKLHNWPSADILSKISTHGILLVPIGNKSSQQDNHLEWRISFSETEKLLIHSFNHTQLMCYALLKLVLKEIINKEEDVKNLLCSYFLKTSMFWVSEEISLNTWQPSMLLQCFWICIQRILYWVQIGYIPNYFIPEQNMISGKMSSNQRVRLVSIIERIKRNGWMSLTCCQSLRFFMEPNQTDKRHCLEYERVVLRNISSVPLHHWIFRRCIHGINKKSSSKRRKMLYVMIFAQYSYSLALHYNKSYCDDIQGMGRAKNKSIYKHIKLLLPYLLIGTNVDAASGWVKMATLFFCTGQHRKAIEVLNHVSVVFVPDEDSSLKPLSLSDTTKIRQQCQGYTILKRLRTELVSSDIYLETPNHCPFFFHRDLNTKVKNDSGTKDILAGSTYVLVYFLRFLSHRHLNQYVECIQSQQCLKQFVENNNFQHDIYQCIAYYYLWKASVHVQDRETENQCKSKFRSTKLRNRIYTQCDKCGKNIH